MSGFFFVDRLVVGNSQHLKAERVIKVYVKSMGRMKARNSKARLLSELTNSTRSKAKSTTPQRKSYERFYPGTNNSIQLENYSAILKDI